MLFKWKFLANKCVPALLRHAGTQQGAPSELTQIPEAFHRSFIDNEQSYFGYNWMTEECKITVFECDSESFLQTKLNTFTLRILWVVKLC